MKRYGPRDGSWKLRKDGAWVTWKDAEQEIERLYKAIRAHEKVSSARRAGGRTPEKALDTLNEFYREECERIA